MNTPHLQIRYKTANELADAEMSPYDCLRYEGWYWTEYGYQGYVGSGSGPFDTIEEAELDAMGFVTKSGHDVQIVVAE